MTIAHAKRMLEHPERQSRPVHPVTAPRFVICNEDQHPREDFRVFECSITTPDGYEFWDVWARDADEARMFVRPYQYGKDVGVLEKRP